MLQRAAGRGENRTEDGHSNLEDNRSRTWVYRHIPTVTCQPACLPHHAARRKQENKAAKAMAWHGGRRQAAESEGRKRTMYIKMERVRISRRERRRRRGSETPSMPAAGTSEDGSIAHSSRTRNHHGRRINVKTGDKRRQRSMGAQNGNMTSTVCMGGVRIMPPEILPCISRTYN